MYNKIGGSMKKISILMITLLVIFIPIPIFASERINVTLNKCVDGDTAWFNLENKKIKARFLAIDTPELTLMEKGLVNSLVIYLLMQLKFKSNMMIILINKINIIGS